MYQSLKFLVRPLVKVEYVDRQVSTVAWLHYRLTFGMLLLFSVIVTVQHLLLQEKKFNCICDEKDDDDEKIRPMIQWCFMRGGFTNKDTGEPLGNTKDLSSRYHSYYIWVPFVLVFQAGLFYAPNVLLKLWKHPLLEQLLANFRESLVEPNEEQTIAKRNEVAKYVSRTLKKNNSWAMKMLLIEFIYLVIPVFNFFFTDYFLQGNFITYGSDVANHLVYGEPESKGPMDKLFPIMSKCTFQKYGPSGTIEKKDLLCVLPMNIVNSKIYFILWFWFHILTALTALSFASNLILTFSTSASAGKLNKYCGPRMSRLIIDDLKERLDHGDWKLLLLIAKLAGILDRKTFAELVEDLWQFSGRNYRHGYNNGTMDGNQNHEVDLSPPQEIRPELEQSLLSSVPTQPQQTMM